MTYEARTFYSVSQGEFLSQSRGSYSCPPFIIANVAVDRVVPGKQISLPEDYDTETLKTLRWRTGWTDKPVHISGRQADDLRHIGSELLLLNAEGSIQPPLNYTEKSAIEWLIHTVETVEQSIQKKD